MKIAAVSTDVTSDSEDGAAVGPRMDLYSIEDLKAAYKKFKEVKQARPLSPSLHFYRGFASQMAGQHETASKHYAEFREASAKTAPDMPAAIQRLKAELQGLRDDGHEEKSPEVKQLRQMVATLEAPSRAHKEHLTQPPWRKCAECYSFMRNVHTKDHRKHAVTNVVSSSTRR